MFEFVYDQYDSLHFLGKHSLQNHFTYVSGDTVFYRHDSEFFVLYDFGASIGDQWIVSSSNPYYSDCDDTSIVVVTDTGSILLNGKKYRYISVQPTSNSSDGIKGTYVERLGNIDQQWNSFQYMFPGMVQCDSLIGIYEWSSFKFKCFEDRSFPLFNPSTEDCEYLLTQIGIQEFSQDDLACYPVPAKNTLILDNNFHSEVLVKIYTLQGILVRSFKMKDNDHIIDISDLRPGVYFVMFQSESDGKFVRKIIKE